MTVLRTVRALRNARLQGTKQPLIEVAENSTDNAVIAACVQALHALNNDFASLDVSTNFSDRVDCSKTSNLGSRANLMRLCRRPDL